MEESLLARGYGLMGFPVSVLLKKRAPQHIFLNLTFNCPSFDSPSTVSKPTLLSSDWCRLSEDFCPLGREGTYLPPLPPYQSRSWLPMVARSIVCPSTVGFCLPDTALDSPGHPCGVTYRDECNPNSTAFYQRQRIPRP